MLVESLAEDRRLVANLLKLLKQNSKEIDCKVTSLGVSHSLNETYVIQYVCIAYKWVLTWLVMNKKYKLRNLVNFRNKWHKKTQTLETVPVVDWSHCSSWNQFQTVWKPCCWLVVFTEVDISKEFLKHMSLPSFFLTEIAVEVLFVALGEREKTLDVSSVLM